MKTWQNCIAKMEIIIREKDVEFAEYRRKSDTKTVRRNVALPSRMDYEAEYAMNSNE